MQVSDKPLNEIRIWPDQDSGSLIHLWLEQDGSHYRVCDGAPWTRRPLRHHDNDLAIPCLDCSDIYAEDVVYGHKLFHLESTVVVAKYGAHTGNYGSRAVYCGEQIYDNRTSIMPAISLSQFARFYEARPADQVDIVVRIRTQLASPRLNDKGQSKFMGHYYYASLVQTIRSTHWATKDIRYFEKRLPTLLHQVKHQKKRNAFAEIGEAYIEFWKKRQGDLFLVPSVPLELDGLRINVRPEIGISNGLDQEVLKLWFNKDVPSRQARQIITYLMDSARSDSPDWADSWNIGIWDVPRQSIPAPIRLGRNFEGGVYGQVASFLRIWEFLERQAESDELAGPFD